MEFSIATLLANFSEDRLVAPKALEKKLGCTDENSLQKLQIALDALERIGILVKDRGRYRRLPEDGLVEGRLRCSSKGFCFAIQDDEGQEDVYIRECHLNTAWNGDRVLVKVMKEGSRRRSPEGEVRLILERANQSILARIKQDEPEQFKAVPLDDRLLFEIDLWPNGLDLETAVAQLANVEVTRYPLGCHAPIGKIAKVLGSDAETASDVDIVCCKHNLPQRLPASVEAAAQFLPQELSETLLQGRQDWRSLLTITLDGHDTQVPPAHDDAITLVKTEAGEWQVGIHITDVAAFVEADSPLDREARRRGNSIYLGSLCLPMLPEAVASELCALLPGSDRLTISLLVTLDSEGQVVAYEVQPGVIQVDHQLDYRQVQAILNRSQVGATLPPDIQALEMVFELVDQLHSLSQMLRQQRLQRGAFELNLPEKLFLSAEQVRLAAAVGGTGQAEAATELVTPDPMTDKYLFSKLHYDDEGELGAIVASSTLLPAHTMVVEIMLLANQLMATHFQALGVPSLYRIHRTPAIDEVQELMKLASNMNLALTLADEETVLPQDYQNFLAQFATTNSERVLTFLLLSTLKPAAYCTHQGSHFGLALEHGYTHFASPLRRYADLLLQRVLHAVFEQGRDRRSSRAKDMVDLRHSSCHNKINWNVLPPEIHHEFENQMAALIVHLNERERVAQEAEADLEGLKKAQFMRAHTGGIFLGVITGVQSYGVFVEIEELLVEGLVHVSSLKDDWYEYRARQQKLVGRKNRQQYRLGDRVEVQVKSVDYYRQQVDLIVVGGGSTEDPDDSSEDLALDEETEGQD